MGTGDNLSVKRLPAVDHTEEGQYLGSPGRSLIEVVMELGQGS
jgi:hypothetical protein